MPLPIARFAQQGWIQSSPAWVQAPVTGSTPLIRTGTSIEIPWLALVQRADPDFHTSRRREIEYEFTGRTFTADPTTRGAYGDD